MHNVCLLGATGSVGKSALAVIASHPDGYRAHTLVGGSNAARLAELCRAHRPAVAVLADEQRAAELETLLAGEDIIVAGGREAVCAAAADASCRSVVAAIAGADGVEPVLAAAAAGKRLLLANKEALIVAGSLLTAAVADGGGALLPVDSEHCALFELLAGGGDYHKLWLTASGGAVRDVPLAALPSITPAQALEHPNWSMGKKITIDSATMMNKVLEIIEAAVLFSATADRIGVVLHPQSICHALVEYPDGALTGSFSRPDMRLPLARMLEWPQRPPPLLPPLDWPALSQMTFAPPEAARYPCLPLAAAALAAGGGAPAALSAANEVAVARFLAGDIAFTDIARINSRVVEHFSGRETAVGSMEEIWQMDARAREMAAQDVPCS